MYSNLEDRERDRDRGALVGSKEIQIHL